MMAEKKKKQDKNNNTKPEINISLLKEFMWETFPPSPEASSRSRPDELSRLNRYLH